MNGTAMLWLALLLVCLSRPVAAETYGECVANKTRPPVLYSEILLAQKTCRNKLLPYVPAKCKRSAAEIKMPVNPFDRFDDPHVDQACVERCLDANIWSRRSGDCAP